MGGLSRKSRGEAAELLFAHKAATEGFTVLFPHSDNCSFDFVLEKKGFYLSFQVKSTNFIDKNNNPKIILGNSKSYKYVDYYAFYIYQSNCFYIIPVKDLKQKTGIRISSKLNKYIDAWPKINKRSKNVIKHRTNV